MTPRRTSRKRKADQGEGDSDDDWTPDNDDENDAESVDPEPDTQPSQDDANEPLVALSKPKRRRKKVFEIDEEEEAKPTYTRKTEKGGYSHTNLSKSRISKANTGNTPWNFGKRRSSADKAKIAAGVRARNRTILLAKLKRLGMTEEEYNQKKKEIKYLRERLRRAKKANASYRDKKIEKQLQDAIDATNVKDMHIPKEELKKEKDEVTTEEKKEEETKEEENNKEPVVDRTAGIFTRDISWRPYPDNHKQQCPTGGPGGLICCEACSSAFSLLLTRTSEDVESHRMIKEAGEVTEILEFLGQKKDVLKEASNAASKKIPPLPPAGSGRLMGESIARTTNHRKTNIGHKFDNQVEIPTGAWDLTSAMDLGVIGGIASV